MDARRYVVVMAVLAAGCDVSSPTAVEHAKPVTTTAQTEPQAATEAPGDGREITWFRNGEFQVTNTSDQLQFYKACGFAVKAGGDSVLVSPSPSGTVGPGDSLYGSILGTCSKGVIIQGSDCLSFGTVLSAIYYGKDGIPQTDYRRVDYTLCSPAPTPIPSPIPSPIPKPTPTPDCN